MKNRSFILPLAAVWAVLLGSCVSNTNEPASASQSVENPSTVTQPAEPAAAEPNKAEEELQEEYPAPIIEELSDYSHIEKDATSNYYLYSNGHFGRFSLKVPNQFKMAPISALDDGGSFSLDEESVIIASSYNNVLDEESTYEQFCQSARNEVIDKYVECKDNWLVRTGVNEEGLFYYIKYIWTADVIYTLYFSYPEERQAEFEEIIKFVTDSWHVMG